MNTTNSTLQQARCASHSGIPVLSYSNVCAITIWQQGLNNTDDPYSVLKNCCPSDHYSYFGEDNCFAYCNATKETYSTLEECLLDRPPRLHAVVCNTGSAMGPMRSVASYLVLAVVFTGLWQFGICLV